MKTIAFNTLGCKVNTYETEAMKTSFIKAGYTVVSFSEIADVYVINTCTVTNISDRKSRQMIRKARKTNDKAIIAAVGCFTQLLIDKNELNTEADIVLGTQGKSELVKYIEAYKVNEENSVDEERYEDKGYNRIFEEMKVDKYFDRTRAFLKIQDGCDNYCSYCIIPYARGSIKSRSYENIIDEAKNLAKNGYKEISLTGINLTAYGREKPEYKCQKSLIDVISGIDSIDGIERIRLGSLEPMYINKEFIEKASKIDKLCPHFHISMQSGCDNVLKRMNRKYTVYNYKKMIENIRHFFRDVAITTDIITGFPGETEKEFNETYKTLNDICFAKTHVFKYSPRKGTVAAEMKNQITGDIKDKRSKILIKQANEKRAVFINHFIGSKLRVLFEQKEGAYIKGLTSNYIEIKCDYEENLIGCIKDVKIIALDEEHAEGEIIK